MLNDPLPKQWWKTGVAFVYTLIILIFTSVILTDVHETVLGESVRSLSRDKFFQHFHRVPWAFKVSEVCSLTLVGFWSIQCIFLKHRAIVARRFFFMIGTLYLYRCAFLWLFIHQVAEKDMKCTPVLYNDTIGGLWMLFQKISEGGFNVLSSYTMCGDYLYNNHIIMLMLCYLFIKEYCPPTIWGYHLYCRFSLLLSIAGIICIIHSHENYIISVVTGYIFTILIFLWYHSMVTAYVHSQPNRYLSRIWWNYIFNFLERDVKAIIPLEFSSPVSKQMKGKGGSDRSFYPNSYSRRFDNQRSGNCNII